MPLFTAATALLGLVRLGHTPDSQLLTSFFQVSEPQQLKTVTPATMVRLLQALALMRYQPQGAEALAAFQAWHATLCATMLRREFSPAQVRIAEAAL
jgi:hypothetical protein